MKRLATILAVGLMLSAASVAIASGGLSGKFRTTLKGSGVGTDSGALDGTWVVDLSAGHISLTWSGTTSSAGTYKVSGSTVTITPVHDGLCKGKGKYSFSLNGATLKFRKISDSCKSRSAILNGRTWTRVG